MDDHKRNAWLTPEEWFPPQAMVGDRVRCVAHESTPHHGECGTVIGGGTEIGSLFDAVRVRWDDGSVTEIGRGCLRKLEN